MSHTQRYRLDPSGYFSRDGQRFIPIGANYWPASCGVEMWNAWPEAEMQHDLDVMVQLKLNTIRFFLRWQDFEPTPGTYDTTRFQRLHTFLSWCRERNIAAHPSLFVGWMSGGIFWPEWKQGRNLFQDPFMLERSTLFTGKAAEVFAQFKDTILSIDQGNEMCCLPDCGPATPAAIIHWCQQINNAVRAHWPEAIMINGSEQNQFAWDTGWRFGQQPGCDLYSMHGYPVPVWHPVQFDGMTDPLAQSLLPFYTQIARAFGPVMLQEFGTIPPFGPDRQENYLRALLPAAWQAGANGYLYWCLRDITAPIHPYTKTAFESALGLVGADDQFKPGLRYFAEFAASTDKLAAPAETGEIGLYFPKHFYERENPHNPENNTHHLARLLCMANYLLRKLGHTPRIIRGDLDQFPQGLRTLIIPGASLDLPEITRLNTWVHAGGQAIWHGINPNSACTVTNTLLGAAPIDYRASRAATLELFGQKWEIPAGPGFLAEYRPSTARVLAADAAGIGRVFQNRAGKGTILWSPNAIEHLVATVSGQPEQRDRWIPWYQGALTALAQT